MFNQLNAQHAAEVADAEGVDGSASSAAQESRLEWERIVQSARLRTFKTGEVCGAAPSDQNTDFINPEALSDCPIYLLLTDQDIAIPFNQWATVREIPAHLPDAEWRALEAQLMGTTLARVRPEIRPLVWRYIEDAMDHAVFSLANYGALTEARAYLPLAAGILKYVNESHPDYRMDDEGVMKRTLDQTCDLISERLHIGWDQIDGCNNKNADVATPSQWDASPASPSPLARPAPDAASQAATGNVQRDMGAANSQQTGLLNIPLAKQEFTAWQAGKIDMSLYATVLAPKLARAITLTSPVLSKLGELSEAVYIGPYSPPNLPANAQGYVYQIRCAQGSVYEWVILDSQGKIAMLFFSTRRSAMGTPLF
jgi:hypothetical protein